MKQCNEKEWIMKIQAMAQETVELWEKSSPAERKQWKLDAHVQFILDAHEQEALFRKYGNV